MAVDFPSIKSFFINCPDLVFPEGKGWRVPDIRLKEYVLRKSSLPTARVAPLSKDRSTTVHSNWHNPQIFLAPSHLGQNA
jgi:hypothetical protein